MPLSCRKSVQSPEDDPNPEFAGFETAHASRNTVFSAIFLLTVQGEYGCVAKSPAALSFGCLDGLPQNLNWILEILGGASSPEVSGGDCIPEMSILEQIRHKMGQALLDYQMIEDGDRILVAVSGGKDSLSLFHRLRQHALRAPIRYSLVPVHVDLGTCRSKVGILSDYFEREGGPFRIVESEIGREICGAEDLPESCCFHCSRIRRKLIFETARDLDIKKIAFGHHLDDLIETCLINMFFAGNISTMLPKQELFGGKIVLIRPFAYCREEWFREYVRKFDLPVQEEICEEGGARSRRRRIKELLSQLESENPGLKGNLFRSLMNVRREYLPKPMAGRGKDPGKERDDCVD
jgi:tRNA 2-thiocytidine biosynthesis protein TtcA